MTERQLFAGRSFELIGNIEPERAADGSFLSLMPQDRLAAAATSQLHNYGAGPFCRFTIGRKRRDAGLYVVTVNDAPVYAGECVDLDRRWGPNGYGGISPRNCFAGGQPTNCRINNLILIAATRGELIALWFSQFDGLREDRLDAETELIRAIRPAWNKAKLG